MKTKSIRVLMIEDEPHHIRLIQALLERSRYGRYELASAISAESGLNLLSERSFDVVLLDLGLPDSKGLETFNRIQLQAPYMPVVIHSALADDEVAVEAVKAGAQDYLVKGEVSAEILSRALNYAIERKQSELNLRQSEEKYRRLIETMNGAFYQISVSSGVYDFISPACIEVFGYPAKDFLNGTVLIWDIIHPDSNHYFHNQWNKLIEGEIAPVWEYKVVDPNGNARWITQSNSALFDEYEELTAIEGICINITTAKQREEEIRHLSSVMEQSTEGMAFSDLEGNVISVNSTFATMHGYTRRELIGKHTSVFYDTEQIPLLKKIRREAQEEGSYNGEMWHVRADGTSFLCQMSISVILDEIGRPIGIGETVRDITELKEAEEALRESEEKMSTIVNTVIDGLYIASPDGHIVLANDAAARMIGYHSKNEIIGLDATLFLVPSEKENIMNQVMEAWKEGKQVERVECRYLRVDGKEIDGEFSLVPINNPSGVATGWVVISRDITDRKRAEEELRRTHAELQKAHEQLKSSQEQLIQAEKMSAIGTMVAGVAHELNNPLTGILQFTRYCIKYTDVHDKRHEILEDIVTETIRCADIVDNLLTFSTMGDRENRETIDCNIIIDRVLRLIQYRIEKESINLIRPIEPVPPIYVHPNSIQQVFLNLIANAFDAVAGCNEKTVTIDIHPVGKSLQITVSDTGVGISVDNLKKVFDPFFTTKEPGKGTGLGLTVTRNIITMHGGTIGCESELGKGSRFIVQLPFE